ncbi:MAG: tRNA pseudouridine(38-40) synthase TruA [bacterium]
MSLLVKNRYCLKIAYNGFKFAGSQEQKNQRTIQTVVKHSLYKLFSDVKQVHFSGRTDAGVHAISQYLHFDSSLNIPEDNIKRALNNVLPDDIYIYKVKKENNAFNARRSASSRVYQYLFTNNEIPFEYQPFIKKITFQPNESMFDQLEKVLVGEHDFCNFRKLGSNEKSTRRVIFTVKFEKKMFQSLYEMENLGHYYSLTIEANSFLYRMVRNLMGAMLEVLKGKYTINEFELFLYNKHGKKIIYNAAEAKGLCLVKVKY